MGEIHEFFVLALSLVWFAGATPEFLVFFVSVVSCQIITKKRHFPCNSGVFPIGVTICDTQNMCSAIREICVFFFPPKPFLQKKPFLFLVLCFPFQDLIFVIFPSSAPLEIPFSFGCFVLFYHSCPFPFFIFVFSFKPIS